MMKISIKLENTVQRRNPVAASLREGQFRKRVVRSKKLYQRRRRDNNRLEG
jgi:hypothetical protein